MGLVVVVVGVLTEDNDADCGEGGVAAPTVQQSVSQSVMV